MIIKEGFEPNAKQKQAIDRIEGPVMLLAGPGTGKTYTLIKRIEKMLSLGISPKSILCLTFSDAASNEMKMRLVEKTGAEATGVNVCTYHSFCMDIIRQNPFEFEMAENVQMADDVTKQAVLKECIEEFGEIEFLKDKWGNKFFYIQSIISGIETIKRERTSKEEFFNVLENDEEWQIGLNNLKLELKEREEKKKPTLTCIKKIDNLEKKIGKAKEFYSIFEIYKRKLNENGLIDYSDMINLVLDKMDNDKDFLSEVSKDYKYVLVDEYQDTSKVQNELIFNILEGAKTDNIFVVGDDDQIIYSFQGARSRNLSDFLERFKNTKVISLEENRRSTQTILDFSEFIMKDDTFRLNKNKNLIAKNENVIKNEQKVKFNIFSELIQENNSIVEKIENLIQNGTKLSEIAIIERKNERLENFARLLKQKNIPYALSKQKNAFETPSFIQIYFYLKILINSYLEQEKLFGLLSGEPFKITDEALGKLLVISRKTEKNWFEIIQTEIQSFKEVKSFCEIYNDLRSKKSYLPLLPFLYEIISKTGILRFYSNNGENRFENISAIQRLIDEAKSYTLLHKGALLEDFIKHLDTYFKQNIKIELKKSNDKKEAVQLVTYHGSKGREFEHVFMPNLTSKAFEKSTGGNRELSLPVKKSVFSEDKEINKDAELSRLLYVGATRAKFGLYLSYSNAIDYTPQTSSKYISNLFPKADSLVEQKIFEIDENLKIEETIKDLNYKIEEGEFKKELEERIKEIIISQTSLNQYLNCPLQYFYSNILKVPVFIEDKDILSYGSAIHYSIDFMTKDAVKNSKWGDLETMLDKFIEKINEAEFSSLDKKEEFIERGKKSIKENFEKLTESSPLNILSTEYKMETKYMGATLKGFADRISKDNQGKILIHDFKTGSYKKIKPDENYHNQLRFYKFLYETLNPGKEVAQTSLIFFEEGCKTSFIENLESDNENIKEKITFAINEMRALKFEPEKNPDNCKNCAYKLVCHLFLSGL